MRVKACETKQNKTKQKQKTKEEEEEEEVTSMKKLNIIRRTTANIRL